MNPRRCRLNLKRCFMNVVICDDLQLNKVTEQKHVFIILTQLK